MNRRTRQLKVVELERALENGERLRRMLVRTAEEALRESEDRFQMAAVAAEFGAYSVDFIARKAFWSAQLKTICGMPGRAEVVANRFFGEFIHPEDLNRVKRKWEKSIDPRGDGRFDVEFRIVRKDGMERWILVTGKTVFDGIGKSRRPLRAVGVVVDVTDRRRTQEELERRVVERTAELARAGERLRREMAKRAAMQDQIITAVESERERIGQDIHDGLCQLLIGIRYKFDLLKESASRKQPAMQKQAEMLSSLITRGVDEARALARGLHPVEAAPEGLMLALQQHAEITGQLFGVKCICRIPNPVLVHQHQVAGDLFRIAQEAVSNAIRHARARSVVIRLVKSAVGLTLEVTNDGKPFPRKPRETGMGLKTMKYRAARIGAVWRILKGVRGKTTMRCEVPLDRSVEKAGCTESTSQHCGRSKRQ